MKFYWFIFLFLISLSLVSAAPPFSASPTAGLEIETLPIDAVQQFADYSFNFHVFNSSNGNPIGNSSTACEFHLYNSTGNEVLAAAPMYQPFSAGFVGNEWSILVNGKNFSNVQVMSYIMQCNSSIATIGGGSIGDDFLVTQTGTLLTIERAMVYLVFMFLVFLLFILALWGAIAIPFINPRDHEGNIMSISWLKYSKMGCIASAYVFLLLMSFMGYTISSQIMQFAFIGVAFQWMYWILLYALFPLMVLLAVYCVYWLVFDVGVNGLIKRGLDTKDV